MPGGPEADRPAAGAWLVTAALLLPSFAFWPFRHHTPAVGSLEEVFFLLPALAAAVLLAPRARLDLPLRLPALGAGALLVVLAGVSAAGSAWPETAWREAGRLLALLAFAWCGAAFLAPRTAARTAMRAVAIGAGLLAALHVAQLLGWRVAGSDPFGLTLSGTTDAPSATFANRNQLASLLVFAWPAAFLASARSRRGSARAAAAWGALAALLLTDLFLTRTEGALLGWAASVLCLAARPAGGLRLSRGVRRLAGTLLALLVVAEGAAVLVVAAGGARVAGSLPRAGTVIERAASWNLAWMEAGEAPWLGHGPGTFGILARARWGSYADDPAYAGAEFLSSHAHDDLLETAATAGVPAALALCALFLLALGGAGAGRGREGSEGGEGALAAAAGLAALLVHSLVHYPLQVPSAAALAWGAAGLLAGRASAVSVRAAGPPRPLRSLAAGAAALVLLGAAVQDLSARASLDRGLALAEAGRLREAEARFLRAASVRPGWSPPWAALGATRLLLGRADEGREALLRARDITPDDPDVLANLGAAEALEGRPGPAEVYFRRALDLEPHHVPALLGLGRILARQKRTGEAAAAFRRVLEADPANRAARKALEDLGGPGRSPPEGGTSFRWRRR